MTRRQRRWHLRIWVALSALITIAMIAALLARPAIALADAEAPYVVSFVSARARIEKSPRSFFAVPGFASLATAPEASP